MTEAVKTSLENEAQIEQVAVESSDTLTQTQIPAQVTARAARKARTSSQRLALALATCGVGHIPLAPGTWGALLGVGLYGLVSLAGFNTTLIGSPRNWTQQQIEAWQIAVELVALIVLIGIGTWAATTAEPLLGRKDPGAIVIDEVAGQLVTFLFVPFTLPWWMLPVGFLLFRFFDILKPYPVHQVEVLPSGLGIMADDLVAGVYAATVVSFVWAISLMW